MSITTKAAAAFLTFALACVGITAIALMSGSREELEEAVSQRQLLLAQNRAIALRDNLDLAGSELLKLGREIEQMGRDEPLMRRGLSRAWARSAFFNRSLQIIGEKGTCILIHPSGVSCPVPAAERESWARTLLSFGTTAFMYVSEPDGTGQITLAVRIGRSKARWILAGTVDLKNDRMLGPALHEDIPSSTRVVLASKDGTVLYRSHALPAHTYLADAITHLGRTEAGVQFMGSNDTRSIVAWAPVGFGDLHLILAWPWNELRSTTDTPMRRLLLLACLATLFALAGGYAMSRLTVRPILDLVSSIRAAQNDPTWSPSPSTRRDEIGTLETAFRDLLQTISDRDQRIRADMVRIADLAATLEHRVAERTRELEHAQAALIDAERFATIGRAAALISHELRNSLNSIGVGADVLSREAGSQDLLPVRQQIHAEINRLRSLSDDLLSLARPVELRIRGNDLQSVVQRAVQLVEDHAAQNGVTLDVRIENAPAIAAIDGDRTQSSLMNLLRNAVDAAAGAGDPRRVRLRVHSSGSDLVFDVDDSGRGVDPAVVPKLYQPFVTTKRNGTGLGLATAKRFIAAHGGKLELMGAGPAGGAWFRITIPRAPQDAACLRNQPTSKESSEREERAST